MAALKNAGFESGDVGWFKEPSWSIVADGNARTGVYAAKKAVLAGVIAAAIRGNDSVGIPAAEGDPFYVDGWIKPIGSPDGSVAARLSWRNSAGVEIAVSNGNAITGGSGYQHSFGQATAPATTASVVPEFALSGGHTVGTWHADDLAFGRQFSMVYPSLPSPARIVSEAVPYADAGAVFEAGYQQVAPFASVVGPRRLTLLYDWMPKADADVLLSFWRLMRAGAGSALQFNGSSSWAWAPDSATLDLTGPLTVECWVKVNGFPASAVMTLVDKGTENAYFLRINGAAEGNDFAFFVMIAGNPEPRAESGVTPVLGRWYHVVGVYDGATLKIYADGVLKHSVARTGTVATNAAVLGIGANAGPAQFANVVMDELRVWNVARTSDQIKIDRFVRVPKLYGAAGLVAQWSMDERGGAISYGEVANEGALTLVSSPSWVAGAAGLSFGFTHPITGEEYPARFADEPQVWEHRKSAFSTGLYQMQVQIEEVMT